MKVDLYKCDRCGERIEVEADKKPITVEYHDGRFSGEEKEGLHLCDDCFYLFLLTISSEKKEREEFDKLADQFAGEEEKEDE